MLKQNAFEKKGKNDYLYLISMSTNSPFDWDYLENNQYQSLLNMCFRLHLNVGITPKKSDLVGLISSSICFKNLLNAKTHRKRLFETRYPELGLKLPDSYKKMDNKSHKKRKNNISCGNELYNHQLILSSDQYLNCFEGKSSKKFRYSLSSISTRVCLYSIAKAALYITYVILMIFHIIRK